MFNFVSSLWKKSYFLLLLPLVLLCGCGSSQASQSYQTYSTPTPNAQTVFASYVGKWHVHDAMLTINADRTGLEQWNAGPCGDQMCGGNAQDTFTVNADGSIKGTTQSVSYSQSNGNPPPAGFQTDPSEPQVGDTYQLRHSGPHLLYTTWLGRLSYLNNSSGNPYWCSPSVTSTEAQKCGA